MKLPRVRHSIANAALAMFSASIGLGAIAVFDFSLAKLPKDPGLYKKEENGYYEHKRNITTYDSYGPYRTRIRTDSYSNRINEEAIADTLDTKSTAVDLYLLGDSFTFGVALPWNETIAGQLERKGWNVVNMGTSSYSPSTSLCKLKSVSEKGFEFKRGGSLVYLLDLSDVNDEANRWEAASNEKCGIKAIEYDFSANKTDEEGRRIKSTRAYIIESFPMTYGLYNAIRNFVRGRVATQSAIYKGVADLPHVTHSSDQEIRSRFGEPSKLYAALEPMRSRIKDIGAFAEAQGLKFYLVIYPHAAQIEHPSTRLSWEEYAKDTCSSISGCSLINAFPVYRRLASRYESNIDFYFNHFLHGDVHFNGTGYSVISALVNARIKR